MQKTNLKKPQTPFPKRRFTGKMPSMLHDGILEMILSYVGFNKDLYSCLFVCKRWKRCAKRYLATLIYQKKQAFEAFKSTLDISKLPELEREEIEAILAIRKEYLTKLDLIPKHYSLFHRVSDLGRLNNPPGVIHFGILAVMYLITSSEEVKKYGGRLDWKFCKKRLQDKNFMQFMRRATPEAITKDRVDNFKSVIRASLVTSEYLHRESTQAALMLEWADKILEYKEAVRRMLPESQAFLKHISSEEDKKAELAFLEKAFSQM